MHLEAYKAVATFLNAVPKPHRVVEFGSRYINGSIRPLFVGSVYTGVDVVDGPYVDVVCDAASFRPEVAPDCVVCCEVLEHAENAKDIVTNAADILAPDGILIVTCASIGRVPHSAFDGGAVHPDEHYRNVPADELLKWFKDAGLVDVRVEHSVEHGDVYAFGRKARVDQGEDVPKDLVQRSIPDRSGTTCSICRRVVLVEHVDGEGRCCYCVQAPAHEDEAARPAPPKRTVPLLKEGL